MNIEHSISNIEHPTWEIEQKAGRHPDARLVLRAKQRSWDGGDGGQKQKSGEQKAESRKAAFENFCATGGE